MSSSDPTNGQTPPTLPLGGAAGLEAIEWRVAQPNGEHFGPTVPMIFAQWIAAGRVTAESLVWRTGWDEWRRADQVAAALPAPLPQAAASPAGTPLPEVPAGATLPPTPVSPAPARAISAAPRGAPSGGAYQLRKRRRQRLRRNVTIGLAVVCLTLVAMLVWLMSSGPPAGAPVISP